MLTFCFVVAILAVGPPIIKTAGDQVNLKWSPTSTVFQTVMAAATLFCTSCGLGLENERISIQGRFVFVCVCVWEREREREKERENGTFQTSTYTFWFLFCNEKKGSSGEIETVTNFAFVVQNLCDRALLSRCLAWHSRSFHGGETRNSLWPTRFLDFVTSESGWQKKLAGHSARSFQCLGNYNPQCSLLPFTSLCPGT